MNEKLKNFGAVIYVFIGFYACIIFTFLLIHIIANLKSSLFLFEGNIFVVFLIKIPLFFAIAINFIPFLILTGISILSFRRKRESFIWLLAGILNTIAIILLAASLIKAGCVPMAICF